MKDNLIYSELDYQKVIKITETIINQYKSTELITIGHSVLGKEIRGVKLGMGKDAVLYAGCFHPIEDLTANLLLKFLDRIAFLYESGETAAGINLSLALKERSIIIIPLMNPDGLDIRRYGFSAAGKYEDLVRSSTEKHHSLWNANARGVDLNHNFNAGFSELKGLLKDKGIDNPSDSLYCGAFPESEPETKALTSFCRKLKPLSVYAFHSQGEEIYFSYGNKTPKKSSLIAEILSSFSGYRLSFPSGRACFGGFKDWFIDEFSKPGFTFEIGKGENPLPISSLGKIYNDLFQSLVYGIIL